MPHGSTTVCKLIRLTVKRWESRTLPATTDVGEAKWIVADYLDVVLHVFTPDARKYYALEDLWGDVPSVSVEAVSV